MDKWRNFLAMPADDDFVCFRPEPDSSLDFDAEAKSGRSGLNATNGRRMFGSTLRVEFSRPGGIRKNSNIFKDNKLPIVSRSVKPTALKITKAPTACPAFA
jgi:hypothetical protein